MWTLIKKIYSRLKEYIASIILALFLSLLGSIATIIFPLFVSKITDEISAGIVQYMDLRSITILTIEAVTLLIFGCIVTFIQNVVLTRVSQLMGKNLRREVNDKVDRIPLAYFDTHNTGDIMNRLTSDIDMMVTALTNYLSSIITAVVVIVCVACIMFYMNIILACVVVVMSFVSLYVNKFLMSRSQPYFIKQ